MKMPTLLLAGASKPVGQCAVPDVDKWICLIIPRWDKTQPMHIVSHAKILEAQALHHACSSALDQWYRLTKRASWGNFSDVKMFFPATDKVGDKFVFDVGGNKLRLIAAIHFNAGRVFVRAVLTHKQCDKGDWK